MAIDLPNSMFIHIPKTGGRWVGRHIVGNVKGAEYVGCAINNAHESPDTDKPVFAYLRHPAPLLNSLWQHRKRKGWNWDERVPMEKECASSNYLDFYRNVIANPGIVKSYFDHFTGKYENVSWGRTEFIADDLVNLLRKFNESFNEDEIIKDKDKPVGKYCGGYLPISDHPYLIEKLIDSESDLINLWCSI